MKKLLLLGLALFTLLRLNAQYQIIFSGTGAVTTVTSVTVENLTKGTSLTLNGTDILILTLTTGVNSPEYNKSNMKIYPNPTNDYATLEVLPPYESDAVIIVSEITGKAVIQKQVHLENSGQGFIMRGLKSGFYLVDVRGDGFQFSGKLVSNGNATGNLSIEESGSLIQKVEEKEATKTSRSIVANVNMSYTAGDRLKFTGSSGNYKTIVTDVPAASKTINFNFVLCRDGDYNIYPVVTIGTQVWMAENLKTTKYNDAATAIPNVTDATWSGLSTAAYCDYSNVPTYSTTYGRMYNWYAIATTNPKKVCPALWHVATNADWTTLSTFLGGVSAAGGKLKETGTAHWTSPNTGATNETGFTAIGGGYRAQDGSYGLLGAYGFWWTSTEATPSSGYYRYMYNTSGSLGSVDNDKHAGFYVRCVKD
jgi:uncharacterized protein (TIGR02145 family)